MPIKYSECDQCGMMRLYNRLIQELDAVDITDLSGYIANAPKVPEKSQNAAKIPQRGYDR